ncbi:M48 family metalloprotease [Sandarakinorhabdus sp.]|uniref:M48 family metalloprotease n=1 Tax=Sandarakinorhabdus sp. TaxID=1916663 RepID=UPI003340D3D8
MRARVGLLLLALLVPPSPAAAQWAGFYPRARLLETQRTMPASIEENFREVIWPELSSAEKLRLGRVTLAFPLENAGSAVNFYASAGTGGGTITIPISSVRLFADIAIASAWLNEMGYKGEDKVADYLLVLRHRYPDGLAGQRHRPLEALGIPANALDNPRVNSLYQKIVATAIVFIIGHELGHLYYGHRVDVTPARSRADEVQADAFGLELMRRIKDPPSGMAVYFYMQAHLNQPDSILRARSYATHPLDSARMRALATGIALNAESFTLGGTSPAALNTIVAKILEVAGLLDRPGVQEVMRKRGQTLRFDQLAVHQSGTARPLPAAPAPAGATQLFAGNYTGNWLHAGGTIFPTTMQLTRTGNSVKGSYSFGKGGVAGNASIDGIIVNGALYYDWRWGDGFFGKGILRPTAANRVLVGTWGYTRAEQGGGTWILGRP